MKHEKLKCQDWWGYETDVSTSGRSKWKELIDNRGIERPNEAAEGGNTQCSGSSEKICRGGGVWFE